MDLNQESPKYKLFIRLLTANQKRIQGFINAMIPNFSASDDIMQETTIFMWEHFDQFEEGSNFAAWGISIARNMAMQYIRKQKRNRLIFDIEAMENIANQSDVFGSGDDTIEALRNCFKKLRDNDQRLLEMKYVRGNSIQTIAENLNRTTSHIYRVMAKVHSMLLKCINLQFTTVR